MTLELDDKMDYYQKLNVVRADQDRILREKFPVGSLVRLVPQDNTWAKDNKEIVCALPREVKFTLTTETFYKQNSELFSPERWEALIKVGIVLSVVNFPYTESYSYLDRENYNRDHVVNGYQICSYVPVLFGDQVKHIHPTYLEIVNTDV